MPELCEIEQYRQAATGIIGRRVLDLVVDRKYVAPPRPFIDVARWCRDARVTAVDRHGKALFVSLARDQSVRELLLRFGMTGRLVVDGVPVIDELLYGERGQNERFDRFVVRFDRGELRIRDVRRLGSIALVDERPVFGPDALTAPTAAVVRALGRGRRTLKAALLDQSCIAGIGNLLADEICWRAGVDPRRPLHALNERERSKLAATVRATVVDLLARGGSHRGDLQPQRSPAGVCPADGAPLERAVVAGRTTYWCPAHQR